MSISTETPTTAEAAKPVRPTKKAELQLRCLFSNDELREKGRELAEAHSKRNEIESELTTVKTQFKSRIATVEAKITELAGHLTSGYEYRKVACTVRFADPKAGQKSIYRLDTGELHATEAMSMLEMQGELPLNPSGDAGTADDGRKTAGLTDESGNLTTPGDQDRDQEDLEENPGD